MDEAASGRSCGAWITKERKVEPNLTSPIMSTYWFLLLTQLPAADKVVTLFVPATRNVLFGKAPKLARQWPTRLQLRRLESGAISTAHISRSRHRGDSKRAALDRPGNRFSLPKPPPNRAECRAMDIGFRKSSAKFFLWASGP